MFTSIFINIIEQRFRKPYIETFLGSLNLLLLGLGIGLQCFFAVSIHNFIAVSISLRTSLGVSPKAVHALSSSISAM